MSETQFLDCDDRERIAYVAREGASPGVVWLGGFNSAMDGNKACAIDAWAVRDKRACVRFDYFGHGQSTGQFRDGTVSRWLADALIVLENRRRPFALGNRYRKNLGLEPAVVDGETTFGISELTFFRVGLYGPGAFEKAADAVGVFACEALRRRPDQDTDGAVAA